MKAFENLECGKSFHFSHIYLIEESFHVNNQSLFMDSDSEYYYFYQEKEELPILLQVSFINYFQK